MSTTPAHRTSGVTESKLMSGSQILLECLVRENVDCIFGYPGGVTLPLYDALVRPSHPPHPGAARAERRVRGRGLCAIHRDAWAFAAPPRAPAPPIWSPGWWIR